MASVSKIHRISLKDLQQKYLSVRITWEVHILGVSPSLVSRFCEGYSLVETASWADSGQLQFWCEPSEILNLRSSYTPETVAFTIPWYQTWWNPLKYILISFRTLYYYSTLNSIKNDKKPNEHLTKTGVHWLFWSISHFGSWSPFMKWSWQYILFSDFFVIKKNWSGNESRK